MSRSDASRKCGGCRVENIRKRWCQSLPSVACCPSLFAPPLTICHHPRIRSTDLTPLELPYAPSGALVASLTINTKIALSPKVIHNGTVKQDLPVDKGRFGSYLKLCDFTLLFMTLQVELRLNKRIISETQTSWSSEHVRISLMTNCARQRDLLAA